MSPDGTGEPVPDAYELIRTAIVENRYEPGQRLVEQRIAEEFGLSRTPVREALRRLEAEGLVVAERNRGARVRPISPTELADLYGLRIRLESYAAELAAERATADDGAAIGLAVEAFGAARRDLAGADDLDAVRRLNAANRRVHDAVVAAARHPRLAAMIGRTVDIPLVFRAFRSFAPADVERSDLFHRLIRDAIAAGDPTRAGALMAEHIRQGLDAVLAGLPADDDDETSLGDRDDGRRALLRQQLIDLASRPDPEALARRVEERKRRAPASLTSATILEHRDAGRR